ncbi:DNA polymerase [Agromyces flavus]|uniref:Type-4 uracil-DNA glycosylase n=1 Tax=Agromyces flavus TaxID=589382 RepID=A0A1H1L7J7_9MICO|nr:UdgX family uracil-DNA binding protein [Agromyces flavus]MCP2367460.1 DNA polymerase [Agromyces flavus]GGI45687.1 uracil-DNA glycosylase [Agromyces flavus]SDR70508.1 DNA polymerase [Agromyces flavus]
MAASTKSSGGAEERPGAQEWVPPDPSLDDLRAAAPGCRGCELYRDATQVVFSTGPARARIMLVGEQPGDREDREGEPFVGPAGMLLGRALDAAGIRREDAYLTNAVKHFRFEQRGKRRIHAKPSVGHVVACHPWLEAEFEVVRPRVVVCLGATAARAVLGGEVRIADVRGKLMTEGRGGTALPAPAIVTEHPSAVLRVREAPARDAAFERLVDDLAAAAEVARSERR